MTLFEKVLKVLNSFAVVLLIICISILLAGYLFPVYLLKILSFGPLAGLATLILFLIGQMEDKPRKIA